MTEKINCKLLTVSSSPERTSTLLRSLDKFKWHYEVINAEWRGFGTKLLATRDYLIANPDITHFFFADAYDVVALGTMEEALSNLDTSVITFSAEKNCWPDPSLEVYYGETIPGGFNFLNSGLYFAPRELFLSLFDFNMPEYTTDDQLWATVNLLFNPNSKIMLDKGCKVFQSYSFIGENDYSYIDGRLINNITNSKPILIHGNGTTNMDKVIELLSD